MRTGPRIVATVVVTAGVLGAAYGIGVVSGVIERDTAFRIDRFDQEVVISSDGSTQVMEDLDVTFTTERRGIFRDLDTRTPFPSIGGFHSFTVDRGDPAEPWNFAQEWWAGGPRIRIGRADQWLAPGTYRYRIGYAAPSWYYELTDDPGTVEVRIDAPGYDWPTTIGPTTISVQVPGTVLDAACVQGPRRTTQPCTTAPMIEGNRATFAVGPFGDHEAATVAVWLDAAAFDTATSIPIFQPRPLDAVRGIGPLPLDRGQAALLLVVLLLIPIVLWEKLSSWFVYRDRITDPTLHDRQHPTALPAPPFGFRPPEVAGLLLDVREDGLFLSALVDLDQRGFVETTSTTESGRWFSKDTETLTVRPSPDADHAPPSELELIYKLLPSGQPATFDGKYDATIASRVTSTKKTLADRAKSVFDAHGFKHDQGGVLGKTWFRVLFVLGFLVFAALVTALLVFTTPLHPAAGGVLVALVLIGWSVTATVWRHHRLPLNSEGRDAVAQARAFEEFVRTVEGEQLDWAAGQPGIDHHHPAVSLLPYAIALGLADSWYDRFGSVMRELAVAGAGGAAAGGAAWWTSQSSFRGVSSAQSGTTTAPSSSGGGGGGGSGGGGGGGGSW